MKMLKEKYITPETEAVEVKEADVITTSPVIPLLGDELDGIDQSFFEEGTGIYDLF